MKQRSCESASYVFSMFDEVGARNTAIYADAPRRHAAVLALRGSSALISPLKTLRIWNAALR